MGGLAGLSFDEGQFSVVGYVTGGSDLIGQVEGWGHAREGGDPERWGQAEAARLGQERPWVGKNLFFRPFYNDSNIRVSHLSPPGS